MTKQPKKWTAVALAALLERKPKERREIADPAKSGLRIDVHPSGRASWLVRYRYGDRQRKLVLGTVDLDSKQEPVLDGQLSLAGARVLAAKALHDVRSGVDPAERKQTDKATARQKHQQEAAESVEAVVGDWLRRDQSKNRSAAAVSAAMERYVLPAWRGRPIASIRRRDCIALIDGVTDKGYATMAHRLHAYLHRLFRWSVGRDLIEVNPMADLPRQGETVSRDRVLTDGELSLIWKAAADTGYPFGQLYQLLILTGARRDEIAALRWSEIDGDKIELKGERTKNGEAHTIPLSPQASAIIDGLPRIAGEYVFSTTGQTPVSGYSKAKAALDAAVAKLNDGRPLADWRVHDLRRTAATGLQRFGTNLQVIEAVLGHISGSRAGVVGVYQRHSFDAEKRLALEAWARHIDSLVSGTPAKVIPLRR